MARGGSIRPKRETGTRFSPSEVRQLEKFLEEGKDELLDESFHQKVTEELNRMPNRSGKKAIQIKQVQEWFEKRKCTENEITEAHNSPEELVLATDSNSAAPESSSDTPEDAEEKHTGQEELEFEARSSRDNAWYDVATFLAHRIPSSGEPEVRVRFYGFGADDDEWVNIKKDVRERSIPLESSECRKVEVGDLVLCFRERSEQAMYFDAHVTKIERKLHDIRGCRCLFMVKYDHDEFEEKVNLKRICRRPQL